jgi:hypothetical protein
MLGRAFVLMIVPLVAAISVAPAQPPAAERQIVENVRSTLLRLPYYGVLDFLAFRYDKGTVTLSGYAYRSRLSNDAVHQVVEDDRSGVSTQSQPHAMASASQTRRMVWEPTVPTNVRSSCCGTVNTWHRLTHDGAFSPSSEPTGTSVGAPRLVEVIAATVTVWSAPIKEGRLSTSTGRRLSGRGRPRSQISPRFSLLATPAVPSDPRSRRARHPPGRGTPR